MGRIFKSTDELLGRERVLNLVGLEPNRYPPGSHFRLRGAGVVSLGGRGKAPRNLMKVSNLVEEVNYVL